MRLTVGQNLQNWRKVFAALKGQSVKDLVARLYPEGEPRRVRYLLDQLYESSPTNESRLVLADEMMALLAAKLNASGAK